MRKEQLIGQGALELLLLIGGAVLVTAIVLSLILSPTLSSTKLIVEGNLNVYTNNVSLDNPTGSLGGSGGDGGSGSGSGSGGSGSGGGGGGTSPACGNGVLEAGEACDDHNLIDGDGCSSSCQIETPAPFCGDGIVNGSESCDGGVGTNTCESFGFTEGTLTCTGCAFDTTACESGIPFAELKAGTFSGILHCGGPTYGYGQYPEYLEGFSTTKPAMFVHYFGLTPIRFSIEKLIGILQGEIDKYAKGGTLGNAIPFIGISFTESTSDDLIGIGHEMDVANGVYDENLMKVIQVFKDYNKPFFIRPGFEFNGSWNGYQPAGYILAYRHIYDKFQEAGVTKGIWVWDHMPLGNLAPFQDYYPGDAYVDYYGVNMFGSAWGAALSPVYMSKTNAFLAHAAAHHKPVLIPESAPNVEYTINAAPPDNGTEAEAQDAWTKWFTPYLAFINNPATNIKGFCYSNGNYSTVPGYATWGNMSLQTSWLKDEWQDELNSPQYVHESP